MIDRLIDCWPEISSDPDPGYLLRWMEGDSNQTVPVIKEILYH